MHTIVHSSYANLDGLRTKELITTSAEGSLRVIGGFMKWIERGIWALVVVTLSVTCAKQQRHIKSLNAMVKVDEVVRESDKKIIGAYHDALMLLNAAAKNCDVADAINFQTLMMAR